MKSVVMKSVVMKSVVMKSVVMKSVVMLDVVAPKSFIKYVIGYDCSRFVDN